MDKKPEAIFFEQATSSGEALGLIGRLFEVGKPDAVYAEPVESGGYTMVTASELIVSMGAGYGGGGGYKPASEDDENEEAGFGNSGGGGGGGFASGRPVAVITVGPKGTKVKPIVDPTKIALAFFAMLATMILSISQVIQMRAKRP